MSRASVKGEGSMVDGRTAVIRLRERFTVGFSRSVAVLFSGLFIGLCATRATADAPYEINAILPLTGPSAFLGSKEAEGLRVLEDVVNRSGGIKGRPLKFIVQNDEANPQVSVQLTAALVAKKVPIILGSSVLATCSAMEPLVVSNGPLSYCLSSVLEPPAGSYQFSAEVNGRSFVPVELAYFRARGWSRIAILETVDVAGQDLEKRIDDGLRVPENRILNVVLREHFQPTDLSVAAQAEKIKASGAQVIVSGATGTSFGTVLRSLHDAGVDLPIFGVGSNMNHAEMAQFTGFAPTELDFVSSDGARAQPDPSATGKRREAQSGFFGALKRAGVRPEYAHALAWDPAMILVDALRSIGPDATALQLRDWIHQQQSWAGNSGVYDFRTYPQRGLGQRSVAIYRWIPATNEFIVVPAPKFPG